MLNNISAAFAGTVAEHVYVPTIVAMSVRVVHIAPVSRGLHGQMRRVGTTCKPRRRSSLGKNHAADMPQ